MIVRTRFPRCYLLSFHGSSGSHLSKVSLVFRILISFVAVTLASGEFFKAERDRNIEFAREGINVAYEMSAPRLRVSQINRVSSRVKLDWNQSHNILKEGARKLAS